MIQRWTVNASVRTLFWLIQYRKQCWNYRRIVVSLGDFRKNLQIKLMWHRNNTISSRIIYIEVLFFENLVRTKLLDVIAYSKELRVLIEITAVYIRIVARLITSHWHWLSISFFLLLTLWVCLDTHSFELSLTGY